MRQTILFITFLMLIIFEIDGQSDFRVGYIIGHQNDTSFGYIDYRTSKKNSLACIFKKHIDSVQIKYNPDDIKAYRFNSGKYYVSKIPPFDSTLHFLEYLIDGIVDIYFYEDNNGEHYFIQKEGEELQELKNATKETIVNGSTYMYESKEYIGILKTNFEDSPELMKKAEKVGLYHNDLIKIAEDYHYEICNDDECIIFAKKKSKFQFDFGVLLGMSISEFAFTDNSYVEGFNEGLSSNKSWNIGVFLNVRNPLISERISIHSELFLTKDHYQSDKVNIEFYSLKIPLTVQYSKPVQKTTPVFMFGLLINQMLSLKDEGILVDKSAMEHGRTQAGIICGVGTEHKFISNSRISFLLRGEYLYGKHYGRWRTLSSVRVTDQYFDSILKSISFCTEIKF